MCVLCSVLLGPCIWQLVLQDRLSQWHGMCHVHSLNLHICRLARLCSPCLMAQMPESLGPAALILSPLSHISHHLLVKGSHMVKSTMVAGGAYALPTMEQESPLVSSMWNGRERTFTAQCSLPQFSICFPRFANPHFSSLTSHFKVVSGS